MGDKVFVPSIGDVDIVSLIAKWFPWITPTGAGAGSPIAVTASQIELDTGTKTATVPGNLSVTLNKMAGVLTTGNLTTAAGGTATINLSNSDVAAADQVFASVANGSNAAGMPAVTTVKPGAGTVAITIQNVHASAALTGTIKVSFAVLKN